jgi:hypothetical protein
MSSVRINGFLIILRIRNDYVNGINQLVLVTKTQFLPRARNQIHNKD